MCLLIYFYHPPIAQMPRPSSSDYISIIEELNTWTWKMTSSVINQRAHVEYLMLGGRWNYNQRLCNVVCGNTRWIICRFRFFSEWQRKFRAIWRFRCVIFTSVRCCCCSVGRVRGCGTSTVCWIRQNWSISDVRRSECRSDLVRIQTSDRVPLVAHSNRNCCLLLKVEFPNAQFPVIPHRAKSE